MIGNSLLGRGFVRGFGAGAERRAEQKPSRRHRSPALILLLLWGLLLGLRAEGVQAQGTQKAGAPPTSAPPSPPQAINPAPPPAANKIAADEISPEARPYNLIMLLTDFGERGYLLGSLKGSIYKAFPGAHIDSLTNEIPKFDIDEAAQTLVLSSGDFPAKTIFVVVVDPGIGRPRTPIALETHSGQLYLAPDNGVLTQVAIRYGIKRVHEITSPLVVRAQPEDSTFLSRDVLGPAAAALAQGLDMAKLGSARDSIYLLTSSAAAVREKEIEGTISLVDGFGNAHTNMRRDQLERFGLKEGDTVTIEINKRRVKVKLVKKYGDVPKGSPLALFGSHDEVQLAINQGNLGETWQVKKGDVVILHKP